MYIRRNYLANRNAQRETQKARLRRQVVAETNEMTEERPLRKRLSVRLIPALLVLCLLAAAVVWFYWTNRHYDSFSVAWEKEIGTNTASSEAFRGYEPFAKGFLRYSKDGAAYLNGDGEPIWERSYQMQNPIAAVSGDYAVIADQFAQSLYIFNDSSNTGAATTVLPITQVTISETGVVYAILKDEKADYITAFKADGSAIDLSIKSVITGDGYPLDISVSPDGTELLTSYVSIENSRLVQKVIFRNFDEVGKEADARRVVGGFTEEFDGHIVGRVHFSSNEYSQAFYDGGIAFFSTKVLTSPALLSQETFEEEINSIAYSDKYAAVVLNTNEGEMPYRLVVYKANGAKLSSVDFDFPYTSFEISGNEILLYNENACRVYDLRGHELLAADFPAPVSAVRRSGMPGELLAVGDGKLMKLKMK